MEHFAFILFVICSIVLFGVSYLSPVPGTDKTSGLTYEKSPITKELNPDSSIHFSDCKCHPGLDILCLIKNGSLFLYEQLLFNPKIDLLI